MLVFGDAMNLILTTYCVKPIISHTVAVHNICGMKPKMSRENDIDEMCQLLATEWKKRPNHRLGQFLLNFIFHVPAVKDLNMWMQQDTTTKKRLELWEKAEKLRVKAQRAITDYAGSSGS